MRRIKNPQLYMKIQSYFEQQVMYWRNRLTLTPAGFKRHLNITQSKALAMRDVFLLRFEPFSGNKTPIDRDTILQFVSQDEYESRYLPVCVKTEPIIIDT